MRINIYLNETNEKDNEIIKYLTNKYSCQAYIKELLYGLATGHGVEILTQVKEKNEKYEEIIGLNDIDL